MPDTIRAKFHCASVELTSREPIQRDRYLGDGKTAKVTAWPRKYRFTAVYDTSIPDDRRFALATPWGEITIQVDNPNVEFEVGTAYYLDFTPVPAAPVPVS